jgi:hypothetical protein
MDFVQRNLINERNNLQVELAKAKLLIAQLSEAYPYSENKYPEQGSAEQGSEIEKRKNVSNDSHPTPVRTVTNNKQGVSSRAEVLRQQARDASFPGKNTSSKSLPLKRATPSKRHFTPEQAEYISDLENVIVALAESMNMSVEELMEMDSWRSMKKMKDIAIAVTNGTAKPLGNGIPAANKLAERIGNRLYAMGVMGAHGEDGKIYIYHQGTAHEHNIKFNNLSRDTMKDGERRAHAENDKAREARVAAKNEVHEQAQYISDLENVIVALAESMNMSVEDLLNEGEARNRRLALGLNKAATKIGAGKKRLEMMDQHVSNVAKTQGGEAGNVADIAVSRLRGPTERGVRDAQAKSGTLETALNTGMAAVKRSRVKRQTNGLFSNSLNKAKQGERVGSISGGIETSQTPLHTRETPKTYMNPNGGKEVTTGTVAKVGFSSSSSLAAQGKLPSKKFGTGADQKTNLAAMRIDSAAKRAAQAQAQSTAAKARNNANKPV